MEINELIKKTNLINDKLDKDTIIKLVTKKGNLLQFVGKYTNDMDIVLLSIENTPSAYKYISDDLKKDSGLAYYAVTLDGLNYQYVDEQLKDKFEIILASVKQNGMALKFIDKKYYDNYDIVVNAVNSNCNALNLLNEINNKSIVLALAHDYPSIINHIFYELSSDKEFMLQIVEINNSILKRIRNKEITLFILEKHNELVDLTSNRVRENYLSEVIEAVTKDKINFLIEIIKNQEESIQKTLKK